MKTVFPQTPADLLIQRWIKSPLVIFDFRVFTWDLHKWAYDDGCIERSWDIFQPASSFEEFRRQSVKLAWEFLFKRGPSKVCHLPFHPVIADDVPPYWRKQVFPDYKAGRRVKPSTWSTVEQIGRSVADKLGIPILGRKKYEADDWAGAFVSRKKQIGSDRPILLFTLDSDWMQLISPDVLWLNTAPHPPYLRGPMETLAWAKKRLKVNIMQPGDLVDTKARQGDRSDNLPPNSDPRLIDLINPHRHHNLLIWESARDQIDNCLETNQPPWPANEYIHLSRYFFENGIPLPART